MLWDVGNVYFSLVSKLHVCEALCCGNIANSIGFKLMSDITYV